MEKLTNSEKRTEERFLKKIEINNISSKVLLKLFRMGYRTPNAVKTLMQIYHPKYKNAKETIMFRSFWNGISRPEFMVQELLNVYENIKILNKKVENN